MRRNDAPHQLRRDPGRSDSQHEQRKVVTQGRCENPKEMPTGVNGGGQQAGRGGHLKVPSHGKNRKSRPILAKGGPRSPAQTT